MGVNNLTTGVAATAAVCWSASGIIAALVVWRASPPGILLKVDLLQAATVCLKTVVQLKPDIGNLEMCEHIVPVWEPLVLMNAVAVLGSWRNVSACTYCERCLQLTRNNDEWKLILLCSLETEANRAGLLMDSLGPAAIGIDSTTAAATRIC